eukprot:Blabericola_migrator_1__2977@NODE_185_length_11802_cov_66_327567_g160_i0_p2_GENE_NODE_185_length_11802_cov_66_327567_g160_i0NODE_185_length_11802_cov_66_327567_g160_i0_p2_ORF_typecomplete_len625_score94_86DUF294_C/PF10335_9/0_28_NODE_185_length_11802_cov_66_327567_g160_i033335207
MMNHGFASTIYPPPPTSPPDNTHSSNADLSWREKANANDPKINLLNSCYLRRSECTTSSSTVAHASDVAQPSNTEQCFPVQQQVIQEETSNFDNLFMDLKPLEPTEPYTPQPPLETSSFENLSGTPSVIKTLLDDVDWSVGKVQQEPQPQSVPDLRESIQLLQQLLLGASAPNLVSSSTPDDLIQPKALESNADAELSPSLKRLVDWTLACHLTQQLLQQTQQPEVLPPLLPTPDVTTYLNSLAARSPPTFSPASDTRPLEVSKRSSQQPQVTRILQSVAVALNDLHTQLISPSSNGFFTNGSTPSISRWRNIDVSFPVFIPSGQLHLGEPGDKIESTYSFEDPVLQSTFGPTILDLFSAGSPSDGGLTPATMLRTRVAVIHKCPDFLVSRMAQLFNEIVSSQCPFLDQPITLNCTRISRCSVPTRGQQGSMASGTDCQERIEALVSPATAADEKGLLKVSSLLWCLADVINNKLASMVSDFYSRLPHSVLNRRSVPEDLYNPSTRNVGLEFRFAPSKQMKIVLAQRGLPHTSSLMVKKIDVPAQVQLCEIRLEQDRRSDKEWDPLFLEKISTHIPTKKILRDDANGNMGRAVFVTPHSIRLPVVTTVSLGAPSTLSSSTSDEA